MDIQNDLVVDFVRRVQNFDIKTIHLQQFSPYPTDAKEKWGNHAQDESLAFYALRWSDHLLKNEL
jgi:hypothetical protein